MNAGRAFVFDPVCAQPFGHNVLGLKYFSDKIGQYWPEVVPMAAMVLPRELARKYGFELEFGYYYQSVMPVKGGKSDGVAAPEKLEEAATADAARILKKYAISADDAIVFPSVDYFGLVGLLNALDQVPPEAAPQIFLRFIGVMENATLGHGDGLARLSRQIARATALGLRVRLCAETPAYADHLAGVFRTRVDLVPYPIHAAPAEEAAPRGGPFTVLCPGSSRLDKGYLQLYAIFSEIRRYDPTLQIRFRLQGLPPREAIHHTKYSNQLYAIPGVTILPTALSEEEMNAEYDNADLVLLPYDATTYRLRGSAVLMECISRGRPVIALDGSAFCDQVRYYGVGQVVDAVQDFAPAVVSAYEADPGSVHQQCLQAHHRFAADSEATFQRWLA